MDAGRLDRRVTVQALTEGQSASGNVTQTWADVVTVWAAFRPLSQREAFNDDAGARVAWADAKFTLRYDQSLALSAKTHRLVLDGRAYDVVGVAEVERRSILEVLAKARGE